MTIAGEGEAMAAIVGVVEREEDAKVPKEEDGDVPSGVVAGEEYGVGSFPMSSESDESI